MAEVPKQVESELKTEVSELPDVAVAELTLDEQDEGGDQGDDQNQDGIDEADDQDEEQDEEQDGIYPIDCEEHEDTDYPQCVEAKAVRIAIERFLSQHPALVPLDAGITRHPKGCTASLNFRPLKNENVEDEQVITALWEGQEKDGKLEFGNPVQYIPEWKA